MGQCGSAPAPQNDAGAVQRAAERQAAEQQQRRRRERQARAEAAAAHRLRETIVLGPEAAARSGRVAGDPPDRDGNTRMHRAAASGDVATVRQLLDARSSVLGTNGRGW